MSSAPPLSTTVVGSFPQPDWLIDRERLASRLPPRVRARELWRVAAAFLDQAQDDATLVAIRAMERAGVDRLPEFLRQVVILAYYQGLKYREIADIVGIPVGTVKSRLHAALVKLHEAWSASPSLQD